MYIHIRIKVEITNKFMYSNWRLVQLVRLIQRLELYSPQLDRRGWVQNRWRNLTWSSPVYRLLLLCAYAAPVARGN